MPWVLRRIRRSVKLRRWLGLLLLSLLIPGAGFAETIQSYFDTHQPIHAPTSDTYFQYAYDSNGNVRSVTGSSGSTTYEYTPFNKLEAVSKDGALDSKYVYDSRGTRIAKLDDTGNVSERYFGAIENTESGETRYYFLGEQRLAKKTEDDFLYFIHKDHLGSSSIITNVSGDPVMARSYYPFGSIKSQSGSNNEPHAYNDKRLDSRSNLYNYNARSYASRSFRFIQPDTVIPELNDPQAFNRYAYVRNNPLKYIDPSGHFWRESIDLFFGATKGAVAAITHNAFPTARKETDQNIWQRRGRLVGASTVALGGAQMIPPGLAATGGGALITAGTGGSGAIVGVPVSGVGVLTLVAGGWMIWGGTTEVFDTFMLNDGINHESSGSTGSGSGEGSGTSQSDINEMAGRVRHAAKNSVRGTSMLRNLYSGPGMEEEWNKVPDPVRSFIDDFEGASRQWIKVLETRTHVLDENYVPTGEYEYHDISQDTLRNVLDEMNVMGHNLNSLLGNKGLNLENGLPEGLYDALAETRDWLVGVENF